MKKLILILALAVLGSAKVALAQDAAKSMSAKNTISKNINTDKDLSALSDGLKSCSVAKKLEAKGSYTFFAINNAGFDKTLHGGTQKMLSPHYNYMLEKILNFHTVEGKLTVKDLKTKIESGNGVAMLKTLNGESLKVTLVNGNIVIADTKGNQANILESDLKQSNGIVHIIDAMLLPEAL